MSKRKILTLALIVGILITTLVFIAGCYGTTEEGGETDTTTSTIYMVVFLVLIFAMFYFLMIRPQRKRQKEHQQLMEELRRGDRVVTVGGIYGVIDSVSEDSVVIKLESGATMRVAKGSVALKQER
jgi:preprotein translocase subunit YajC